MTDEEKFLLTLTAHLWNLFLELPGRHPEDAAEMMRDIHSIQNRIMARAAVRSNPEFFHKPSTEARPRG